jgi:hypothetical protein
VLRFKTWQVSKADRDHVTALLFTGSNSAQMSATSARSSSPTGIHQ